MGQRHAVAVDDGSRWRYVRDVVSVHINTKACAVETMLDCGEVDATCCRKATEVERSGVNLSVRAGAFWLMFRGNGSKLDWDQEFTTTMCESTLAIGTSGHIAYAYVEGHVV